MRIASNGHRPVYTVDQRHQNVAGDRGNVQRASCGGCAAVYLEPAVGCVAAVHRRSGCKALVHRVAFSDGDTGQLACSRHSNSVAQSIFVLKANLVGWPGILHINRLFRIGAVPVTGRIYFVAMGGNRARIGRQRNHCIDAVLVQQCDGRLVLDGQIARQQNRAAGVIFLQFHCHHTRIGDACVHTLHVCEIFQMYGVGKSVLLDVIACATV